MEKKRKVAVFDFDGTLTTKDTFVEFIKYACGAWKFFFGFLLYSPLLVLMKLRLYPNWKCKQKVFSFFFKGMDHNEFRRYCDQFSEKIEEIKNPKTSGKKINIAGIHHFFINITLLLI